MENNPIGSLMLKALYIKHTRHWNDIYKAILDGECAELADEKELKEQVDKFEKDNDCQLISIMDDEYPERLKKIERPLFVLEMKVDSKFQGLYFAKKDKEGDIEHRRTKPMESPGEFLSFLCSDNRQPITITETITKIFNKSGVMTAHIEEDAVGSWLVFNDGLVDDLVEETMGQVKMKFANERDAVTRAFQICEGVLFLKCDSMLYSLRNAITGTRDDLRGTTTGDYAKPIMFTPGKSGSLNNFHIKNRDGGLVDIKEDLMDATLFVIEKEKK